MHNEQRKKSYAGNLAQTLPIMEKSESRSELMDPPLKSPPLPAMPTENSARDRQAEKVQKVGRRKSIMAMFGK